MEELMMDQAKFIYSENEQKPFTRVWKTSQGKFFYSDPFKQDTIIKAGSKLFVKPCFPQEYETRFHYEISLVTTES
jgi:hypothetical protein